MKNNADNQQENIQPKENMAVYKRPLIIYDGIISTRAGSPLGNEPDANSIDPADLFN